MIKLIAEGKFIDTKEIKHLLTQGEKNADMIQFVIGIGNDGVDISGCSFTLRTVASEGSMTETVLSKLVVDDNINLIWTVPDTATAIAGMLRMELIGVKNNEVIIKFKMPPIYVKEAVMGSNVPLPDIMDQSLDEMHKLLDEMKELSGELPEGSNIIDEVKNARKGVLSSYTYNTLGQRLAAEFNTCVQKDYMESRISTMIRQANDTGVGRFWREPQGPTYGEIFGDYEYNKASREYSHAEGHRTTSSGYGGSHAEGNGTEASNFAAHAEGSLNIASGDSSHAEGNSTEASGEYSHTEGYSTIAASEYQHVQGKYNIEDSDSKYAFIIGNGTANYARSNAMTLDWDGNLWTAGDVTARDFYGNRISLTNSIINLRDSLGMLKSKNLLKNTVGTATQNGITFTHNSDGSVTCNGTATADTNYRYIITLPIDTSFILSGCPTGGSTSTYNLFAMDADTWSKIYRDTSSSVIFNTGTCSTWHFIIRVANGQTVSNMTFYPMLRRADIYADDVEYEPYVDDLQTQIDKLKAAILSLGGNV